MTPEQAAGAAKPSVLKLGGAFIESPRSLRRARQMGLSGWAFLVTCRGAVLGDVSAETVAAAIGLFAPEAVADGWEAALRVTNPIKVAEVSRAECGQWGIDHLSARQAERLVRLIEPVVQRADAAGMPLFAAWRATPVAADAPEPARAAILLHLLFEYFNGAGLIAVRAAGMTPVEALLAGPEGEALAMTYGWSPPYPPVGPLVRRRLWVESATDRIAAPAFAALTATERGELINLLGEARASVGTPAADPS